MPEPTNVFYLEYSQIMREVVMSLVDQQNNICIKGDKPGRIEMDYFFVHQPVDILIIGVNKNGISFSPAEAITVCGNVRKRFPAIRIIVHSSYDHPHHIAQLMNAGASGFASKYNEAGELLLAIDTVSGGFRFINAHSSAFFSNTASFVRRKTDKLLEIKMLFSPRELEVLKFVAQGFSNKEIGDLMFISDKTVETHRHQMIRKSRVKNTAELISFSFDNALL